MPTLNWCYGAYAPTQHADAVDRQYWLAHRYKNKLIELERTRRDTANATVRRLSPEYDAAVTEYEACQQRVDMAYASINESRAKARKRVQPTDAQQSELDAAKASRKAAAQAMADLKQAAWDRLRELQQPLIQRAEDTAEIPDACKPATRKRIVRAEANRLLIEAGLGAGGPEHEEAVRQARGESGVFWGTYLIVEEAMSKIGEGTPPKFRQFDGNGSIAVQLQGGLTLANAVDCEDTRLRLYLPELTESLAMKDDDSGLRARGEAWIRIGTEADGRTPIWTVVPFVYHRALPKDAVIKWAMLDRRRHADKDEYTLRLVLQTETQRRPSGEDGMVSVHLGYRNMKDGLRVATIYDGDAVEEIYLSDADVKAFYFPDDLEAVRDGHCEGVRAELIDWLKAQDLPEEWQERVRTISHWRGTERFQALIAWWRDHRFEGDSIAPETAFPNVLAWARVKLAEYQKRPHYKPRHPDDLSTVFGLLDFWRKFDKHLQQWSYNQGRKAAARRDLLYRNIARRLRDNYKHVVLAKINWKEMAAKPDIDEGSTIPASVRRVARIASPGILSQYLKEAFAGDVISVSEKHITAECATCGAKAKWEQQNITGCCANCQTISDLDHNAARITLARGRVAQQKSKENTGETGEQTGELRTPRKSRRNRKTATTLE